MNPLPYPISVTLLYYGGSAGDLQDTLEGVESLYEALKNKGHMVRKAEVTRKNWKSAVMTPGDVVFNLVEDEDYSLYLKVARRLELFGKAQVGIGWKSLKFVVKKARVKRKMQSMGILTPKFRVLNRRSNIKAIKGMEYPLIVKPSGQHAGIGINQDSVVIDKYELEERVGYLFKNFPGEVIAEEYIDGREIHMTVLGNGKKLFPFKPAEITFGGEFKDNWNVYTYEAKWEKTSWEYWDARVVCPPIIGKKLLEKIERTAKKAFRELSCRDIARFDFRIDEKERLYVVDVNMCPSLNAMDEQDATVISARAMGLEYEDLVENVTAITYKRIYGVLPDRIRERRFLLASPNI